MKEKFPFVAGFLQRDHRLVTGIALIAALGGFLFGYDTGVIGGALLFLKKDMHLDAGQQQTVVASLLVGATIGAVVAGYLADAISRRWTKCLAGGVYFFGALAAALSQQYWQLVAARFFLGLAVGCASFVGPLYIAEQVDKRMRGGTVSFNQLMITSGILLAYIADWRLSTVPGNWRWMMGLGAIPGAALSIGMFFVPHTPRWLLSKGREEEPERSCGARATARTSRRS